MKLTYILFIILTGMVTILFAGVALKKKSVDNPYKCALGLEDHKPFLESKWTDATKSTGRNEFTIIPSGNIRLHGDNGDNFTGTATYALAVDSLGNIIDTVPQLPIHWTKDSTQAYFDLDDLKESFFSISDSTGELARRDNKTGKWIIRNCRRALEVVYQLDSIRNAQPPTKEEPESKTEIFLHSSNK